VYLPSDEPDHFLYRFANRTCSFIEWVVLAHEYIHLSLNFTPIKELARFYLGRIYDSLEELLCAPEDQWSETTAKSWDHIKTMNKHLGDVFERTDLTEELLATAFTFSAAEVVFQSQSRDKLSKLLSKLEEVTIDSNEWHLVGFKALYYDFKKVFQLANNQQEKRLQILVWLGVFLQPIEIEVDAFSRERCEKFLDHISPIKNCTQLLEWLQRQISEPSFIQNWQTILQLSMQNRQKSKNMRLLGELSMANSLLIKKEVNLEDVVNLIREIPNQYLSWPHLGVESLPYAFLYPKRYGNAHYVVPFNADGNYNKYRRLLFLESVRQQLNTGIGFRYPFLLDDIEGNCTSVPQPLLKQGIKRLACWAMEGRFGPGEWTDVVFPP
jgi:hypothetical protein